MEILFWLFAIVVLGCLVGIILAVCTFSGWIIKDVRSKTDKKKAKRDVDEDEEQGWLG